MVLLKVARAVFLLSAISSPAQAELSPLSKRLARCNAVYAFAIAWRQSEGDTAGLNEAINQYARVVTANFWLNEVNGGITTFTVREWYIERIGLGEDLFNDRDFARREIAACKDATDEGWRAAQALNKVVGGKSLEQFLSDNAASARTALGL